MHIPRKIAVAVLAGVSVAGLAGASAASLGGLTASQVGSENAAVGACDSTGIASSYTTAYSAAAQRYQVTAVNFTNVDPACNAKAAAVTLRQGATALTSQSVPSITVTSNSFSVTLTTPVDAALVDGISIVISG